MVTLEKHIGILHLAVTDHSHTSLPYLKTPKLINIKHFSSNTSVPARGGNNICAHSDAFRCARTSSLASMTYFW